MSATTTCRSLSMIATRTARSSIHGSASSYELSWPNSRSVRAPGTRPDRGDLMHASRTFTTRIDIPEQSRRLLIELLNARLADAFDLYSQLKQAHWNVKGSDFIQLHELYDTVAADVLEHVDAIAERANGPRRARARNGASRRKRLDARRIPAGRSRRPRNRRGDLRPPRRMRQLSPGGDRTGARAGRPRYCRPVHRGLARDRQAPLVRRSAPATVVAAQPPLRPR